MTDTPEDLLLLEAEHLARDLLLDADPRRPSAPALLNGWAPVLQAASHPLEGEVPNPLSQVLEIWHGMRSDTLAWVGRAQPDPRLTRIRLLFEDINAGRPGTELPRHQQEALLQTCYLVTHARARALDQRAAQLRAHESTKPQGVLVGSLGTRLQGAEQILDAHLSIHNTTEGTNGGPTKALEIAITAWDRAVHEALVDRTPDPRVLLANANVSLGLLRHTAALAQRDLGADRADPFDVRTRLVPSIARSIQAWQADRDTWRSLATLTTGVPKTLALAADGLHQALMAQGTTMGSDVRQVLRVAVLATVEAANLQVQATRRPDLKGTASGVSALTQEVFEKVPGARSLGLWHQLERLAGPQLIPLPTPVRTELLRHATTTLAVSLTVASATHSLNDQGRGLRPHTVSPRREVSPELGRQARSQVAPRLAP